MHPKTALIAAFILTREFVSDCIMKPAKNSMSSSRKRRSVDLTTGPIALNIFLFALPLLGSSLVQQLYNTVDLLFAGNVLGTHAAAAMGISSLLITCFVGLFTGISVGSNVVVARFLGAGEAANADRAVHSAVAFGLWGGVFLGCAGWVFAPLYTSLMGASPDIAAEAVLYLRVYFLSLPAVIGYNMCAGIIRAYGDSRTPFYAQCIGGLANVLFNAVFMVGFGMGLAGAAWATFVAQGIALCFVLAHLIYADVPCRLCRVKIKLHADALGKILKIGLPAGLQFLVITLSNVFVQFQIDTLGTQSIAAFTTYFKVELILYLPIVALGQAITTFVGQNSGAGCVDRARKGTRLCIVVGIVLACIASMLLLAQGRWVFWIFNQDEGVIGAGMSIISVTFPFYWVYVILEICSASLRGRGNAFAPMVVILVALCVFRSLLLAWVMSVDPSLGSIALVYPVSWAFAAAGMAACYFFSIRSSTSWHN